MTATPTVAEVVTHLRLNDTRDAQGDPVGREPDAYLQGLIDVAAAFPASRYRDPPDATMKHARLLMVAAMYQHRGDDAPRYAAPEMWKQSGAAALLAPWRIRAPRIVGAD